MNGDDPDLFDYAERNAFARGSDPDTSREAADSMNGKQATRLEGVVVEGWSATGGKAGAIIDEVMDSPRMAGLAYGSVTPRIRPLICKGLLIDTGERRPGRSGRMQRVLVATRCLREEAP